ncbi:MAG: DUF58 domain-containing protein [Acetobacteraceae bacterium]|nr:DUF58 domain-containing protein [Acetobacteraceae bacterium]
MKVLFAVLLVVVLYSGSVPLFIVLSTFITLWALARIWLRLAAAGLRVERYIDRRLFFGERATVRLEVRSQSALPLPWVLLREHQPLGLASPSVTSHALSLSGRQTATICYELTGSQRGYHQVGPLQISAGDVFGLARVDMELVRRDSLIVYPRLLQAHALELPMLALYGDLRSRRRLVTDPARLHAVREYVPGDALHDIHWRATASTGSLQVKQYQPSTAAQTLVFLDLQRDSYPRSLGQAAVEYAISLAATIASRLLDQRQQVGLATTGQVCLPALQDDVVCAEQHAVDGVPHAAWRRVPEPLAPARGRGQLLQMLDVLACLELNPDAYALSALVARHALSLPWGSTVVIISALVPEDLFLTLHRLREAGLPALVLCVRRDPDQAALEARARALGARILFLPHDQYREAMPS